MVRFFFLLYSGVAVQQHAPARSQRPQQEAPPSARMRLRAATAAARARGLHPPPRLRHPVRAAAPLPAPRCSLLRTPCRIPVGSFANQAHAWQVLSPYWLLVGQSATRSLDACHTTTMVQLQRLRVACTNIIMCSHPDRQRRRSAHSAVLPMMCFQGLLGRACNGRPESLQLHGWRGRRRGCRGQRMALRHFLHDTQGALPSRISEAVLHAAAAQPCEGVLGPDAGMLSLANAARSSDTDRGLQLAESARLCPVCPQSGSLPAPERVCRR